MGGVSKIVVTVVFTTHYTITHTHMKLHLSYENNKYIVMEMMQQEHIYNNNYILKVMY
jgi:hypothetical protein